MNSWEAAAAASRLRGVVVHAAGSGYGIGRLVELPRAGGEVNPFGGDGSTVVIIMYEGRPHVLRWVRVNLESCIYFSPAPPLDASEAPSAAALARGGLTTEHLWDLLDGYPEVMPGPVRYRWTVTGVALVDVVSYLQAHRLPGDPDIKLTYGQVMPNGLRHVTATTKTGSLILLCRPGLNGEPVDELGFSYILPQDFTAAERWRERSTLRLTATRPPPKPRPRA